MEVDVGAQEMPIDLMPMDPDADPAMIDMVESVMADDPDYMKTLADIREEQSAAYSQGEKEETEDLSEVPASPIRNEWPADSVLKPDHFTIDQQPCLNCNKKLGYAMPMNRIPKVKYLFCENSLCQTAHFLQCFVCGKYQSENTAHLVHRPGNSAYQGPSQIYSFMCHYCYKDQLAMEPGLEETREAYKKYREVRQRNEEEEYPRILKAQQKEEGFPSVHYPGQFQSRKRCRVEEPGTITSTHTHL